MADDNIDLRFPGQQVQALQGDVRELRAGEARRDVAVAAIRTDLAQMHAENNTKFEQINNKFDQISSKFEHIDNRFGRLEFRVDRLEQKVDNGFASVDLRFQQMAETMATNLQVVLAAIKK